MYVGTPVRKWQATKSLYSLVGCATPNERAGCVSVQPDQAKAVQFVRNLVPHGEKIYLGAGRHDTLFSGDLLFYFLADRHSATKYQEMIPRFTTTLPIQRRIVEDLKRARVRCIVLYSGFSPNARAESTTVTYLDDFIRANFRIVQQSGEYAIWTIRGSVY